MQAPFTVIVTRPLTVVMCGTYLWFQLILDELSRIRPRSVKIYPFSSLGQNHCPHPFPQFDHFMPPLRE